MTAPEVLAGQDAAFASLLYQGVQVTAKELLERYNPKLVLLPRHGALNRPGSWWRGEGRGDYYPCTAEFFLSKVAWYQERRGLFKKRSRKEPDGLKFLKDRLTEAFEEHRDVREWEIDIAPFDSGNARKAWKTYGEWLTKGDAVEARKLVTYARCKPDTGSGMIALQYWYLYIYNDAGNTHEGDWEMATIELDPVKGPTRVAYSGHNGGARRRWEGISRDGEHPLIYVARGSHAAYLEHMPLGHKTAHLDFDKGFGFPLKQIVLFFENVLMKSFYFWGVRDYTASIDDEGDGNRGFPQAPEVRVMPDSASVYDEHWWWMNLNCRWGSSHTRIRDFIAPEPAWMKPDKWETPLVWLAKQNER